MLDTERRFYENHRHEWLSNHEGEYVLIKDDDLYGFYPTQMDAVRTGRQRFGNEPFMAHHVSAREEPITFSPRPLWP